MKHSILVALLVGITAASHPLLAQNEGGEPGGKREPSPAKAEMEEVETALDAVKTFLEKPEGEAPLAQIAAAQESLLEAKKHTPRSTERQPEDKRAGFVTDYKVQINKAIRAVLDLEDAMLQQDWKAAGAAVEAIEKLEKAGHDKFKPKRRNRGAGEGGGNGGEKKGESGKQA